MTDDLQTFKNNLIRWEELKKRSDEFTENFKRIKEEMEVLKKKNIEYMAAREIDVCNTDDGKISLRKVTRTVIDVKRTNLPDILNDYFITHEKMTLDKANEKVKDIMNFITLNYSKCTESMSLVKTYNK
jgi:hypothetical protein